MCCFRREHAGQKGTEKDSGEAVSREFLESRQREYIAVICNPEERGLLDGFFICIKLAISSRISSVSGILVS